VAAVTASRLHRNELVGMAAGALLALAVFLTWYATSSGNVNSTIDGDRGSFSAWDVHPLLRWLLLLAASAPFILAWIVHRGESLSWARGEVTMVASLAALALVLYNGLIDRPGSLAVSLRVGWFLAVVATLVMTAASARRASEFERPRKPPGTI
jgi:hypothetical protein